MRAGNAFAVVGLLAFQGVAATGWYGQYPYPCPGNTKNDCSSDEKKGFDWQGLPVGPFSDYKNYQFKGWTCTDGLGKRSLFRRTNDGCEEIVADMTKGGFGNEISRNDGTFSVDEIDISVEVDVEIEFQFEMPDGSTCKKVSSCKRGGCTVKNDQCGGAKSLKVKIHDKSIYQACKLGIRSIRFNCNTKTTSLPVTTTTTTLPTCHGQYCCKGKDCDEETISTSSTSKPCKGGYCNTDTHTTTTTSPTNDYPEKSTPTSTPTTNKHTSHTTTTSGNYSKETTPSSAPTTSTSTPKTYPKETPPTSTPTTSHPHHTAYTSSAPYPTGCTGEGCAPPTSPACQYGEDCKTASLPTTHVNSTRPAGCTGIGCGNSSKPPPSSTKGHSTTSSTTTIKPTSSQYPPVEYPPTLPRCLKTWIFIISCTDTANTACFCLEAEFVTKVSDCVQSWGKDSDDIAKSLELLMGLCQPFIPKNPAIVTCIPPDVTLPVPTVSVPVTTVVQTITTVIPCETTTPIIKDGSSIPVYSNISMTTQTTTLTHTIPKVTLVTSASDATPIYPTAPGPSDVPATFDTGVATPTGSPATPTGSTTPTAPSYPGAAAGLYPATFVAVVGAFLAVAFQQ